MKKMIMFRNIKNLCNKSFMVKNYVQEMSVTKMFYSNNEVITVRDKTHLDEFDTRVDSLQQVQNNNSALKPLVEDISHISTYLKPTFNVAAYINKSETLQELVKLGVNLHKIEKNKDLMPFILAVKFEEIKEHIIFFKEMGLNREDIANLITKNPAILKENLEDIQVRINYLQFKNFTDEMILHVIKSNSFWLSYSTQDIDNCLGFVQNHFKLTGNEVRLIATSCPKLITQEITKTKLNTFVVKEEMGFNDEETKKIILKKPSVFIRNQHRLLHTFEYLHKVMDISLEMIAETPDILTCRKKRLKERHLFLVKLEKAQYNPKIPNYISLLTLASGTDAHFSTELAKSSIQAYNVFLKSI